MKSTPRLHTGVDDVRELRDRIAFAPGEAGKSKSTSSTKCIVLAAAS
ncbi:MAG: hypothetical protein U0694_05545 [Anaerolineae bacterium]